MKFAVPKFLTFRDRDGYNKSAAQVVYPITPEHGPWSGSNNLGQVVSYSPDAFNRQTILKLDEWGPPEMWTLSLYWEHPTIVINNSANYQIVADIEFGAGGSTQHVEVDWNLGTMLSLPMNALNVSARYIQFTGMPNIIEPGLRLGAQIARGTRAGGLMPTRTVRGPASDWVDDFAGTFSPKVRIPNFARTIEVIPAGTDLTPFDSTWALKLGVDNGTVAGLEYRMIRGDELLGKVIPITAGLYDAWMMKPTNAQVVSSMPFFKFEIGA